MDRTYEVVGLILFLVASLVNLLAAGAALAHAKGKRRAEYIIGIFLIAMALPVGVAVVFNMLGNRAWWAIIFPSLLLVYFVIEWLFHYVWKLDFRSTSLFWPYIILYYLATSGMLGFSFALGAVYGFIYLFTYFLNLFITWAARPHAK